MAGSPEKDRSLDRRVAQLERELSATTKQLEQQTRRLFQHQWPRDTRLAKTVNGGAVYDDTGNTFYIELLDSYFTATPGTQTPTHANRGERLVGHVIGGCCLAEGTICFALYSRGLGAAGAGEWWIWPIAPENTKEALATLVADMCPSTAIAQIANVEMLDAAATAPTEADNLFVLSGLAGDLLKIKYRPSTGRWFIEQVKHHERAIVVEDPATGVFIKYDDCKLQGFVLEQSSIMSCKTPLLKNQIQLQQFGFVQDVGATAGCGYLWRQYGGMCGFGQPTQNAAQSYLAFTEMLVLVGVGDNGVCAYVEYQAICVVAVDQTVVTEDLICGVDCEGSGSGSQ